MKKDKKYYLNFRSIDFIVKSFLKKPCLFYVTCDLHVHSCDAKQGLGALDILIVLGKI